MWKLYKSEEKGGENQKEHKCCPGGTLRGKAFKTASHKKVTAGSENSPVR